MPTHRASARSIVADGAQDVDPLVVVPETRQVFFVLYPGFQLLDLAGPYEVLVGANRFSEHRTYDVQVLSLHGGSITSDSGILIGKTARVIEHSACAGDTVVIVGGRGTDDASADQSLVDWVRALPASVRCVSVGGTAGIDLALAIVEADLGPEVAQSIARLLVMFLHGPGGESQFAPPVWSAESKSSPIRDLRTAITKNVSEDWTVRTMASHASMSTRNFVRVFTRETCVSPARYVEQVRVDAARGLLERTNSNTDVIARLVGFGTPDTMRRVFLRRLGTTPGEYRHRFQITERADS
jgi:transcriptional regulator GlxA family with amidase domain